MLSEKGRGFVNPGLFFEFNLLAWLP